MRKNTLVIIAILIITVLIGGILVISNQPIQMKNQTSNLQKNTILSPTLVTKNDDVKKIKKDNLPKLYWDQPPKMSLRSNVNYSAVLETSEGDIELALDSQNTPRTVNNFVFLAKQGFYNGTIFHRVIKGFMIQGGDPDGTGRGGPGYMFADEPFIGEYKRGVLAMANAGPDTNGSQFFIMQEDKPLPANYVIFGHVASGMEVVDKIASAQVKSGVSGENSVPIKPAIIREARIAEN